VRGHGREASVDQAEVIAAQLLRVPLDGYTLVVLDLAELTFLSSLPMRWNWPEWGR
jgi:hypothetical protein